MREGTGAWIWETRMGSSGRDWSRFSSLRHRPRGPRGSVCLIGNTNHSNIDSSLLQYCCRLGLR